MFDFAEFKQDMNEKGHRVDKKGIYVTVSPRNERYGFDHEMKVVEGYEEKLKFIAKESIGQQIFKAQFRIINP